jgi:hypothetical protein
LKFAEAFDCIVFRKSMLLEEYRTATNNRKRRAASSSETRLKLSMSDRANAKHSCLADKAAPPTVRKIADNNHSPNGLLKNVTAERGVLRFRKFWILAYLGILTTPPAQFKNAICSRSYAHYGLLHISFSGGALALAVDANPAGGRPSGGE